MPIYEYECDCGEQAEISRPLGEAPKARKCRVCGGRMYRVFSLQVWTAKNNPLRHQGALLGRPMDTREDVRAAERAGICWPSKKDHERADSLRGSGARALTRAVEDEAMAPERITVNTSKAKVAQ